MTALGKMLLALPLLTADGFISPPSHSISPLRHAPQTLLFESTEEAAPEAEPEHKEAALPSEESSDILNSPAFLKRKVEVLQSDLAALEKTIEEADAVYTANKAEWGDKFDKLNDESRLMQERFTKMGANQTDIATVDVVGQILNVIDTFERAFQAVEPSTEEQEKIVAEYKGTYDKILDCFAELNVTKVETVGAEFDYELHQAMMQMPSEFEEGIVCQEFAPGWICGDRLIRPAMVAVSL